MQDSTEKIGERNTASQWWHVVTVRSTPPYGTNYYDDSHFNSAIWQNLLWWFLHLCYNYLIKGFYNRLMGTLYVRISGAIADKRDISEAECRERLFPHCCLLSQNQPFRKGRSEMITLPPYYHSPATSGQVETDPVNILPGELTHCQSG